MVDDFNRTATLSRVSVYAMIGRVAADDVEAVKAINSEVSDLLGQMQEGLKNLDVKSIRDAATKAKQIGQMLSPTAAASCTSSWRLRRPGRRPARSSLAGEQAAAEDRSPGDPHGDRQPHAPRS